jgi:hypothetical protein
LFFPFSFRELLRGLIPSDSGLKPTCRYFVGLVCTCLLVAGSVSDAAELKPEALRSWDEYVQSANAQMMHRVGTGGTFLWIDEVSERGPRVRAGKILVSPTGPHIPKPVPTGLIHDWIGAAFFPNTKLNDVLAVVRDYDRYKDFTKLRWWNRNDWSHTVRTTSTRCI